MRPRLGTLEQHADGVFSGVFRSLSIRVQIELRPLLPKDGVKSFAVIASPDFLFGRGCQAEHAPLSAIALELQAAELPQRIFASAILIEEGRWAIEWLVDAGLGGTAAP